ncbi:hypothetical protein MVEG_03261 [Podila verticillata NRRL 6337]|nr:hypothetical protein MVEG_03261 [Podila verticillata NRRL 6337]
MADPSTAQPMDTHEDDAENKPAIADVTSTSTSTSTQRTSHKESARRGKAKFVFGEEAEDHEQDGIDDTTPKAHTQYNSTHTSSQRFESADYVPSERISSERSSHMAGTGEAGPSSLAKTLIDSTIQPMQTLALQEPRLDRIPEQQQRQEERATRPVKESNRVRSRSGEPPKTTISSPDRPKQRVRAPSDTMSLSKRIPSLLNRSISSTSIPAVTKVTAQNVLAVNPVGGSTATTPSSSMTDNSTHPGSKIPSPTISSPASVQGPTAQEMVSKFLHAKASSSSSGGPSQQNFHTRSRSHSNLRSVQESTSPTSPNHRQNPSNVPPSAATSPHQRTNTGYTSKFYPASPSRAQLSSSAPKSSTLNIGTNLNPNTMIPQGMAMMSAEDPVVSSESPYYNGVAVPSAIAAAAEAQSNLAGESKSARLSRTQQKLWLQRDNLQDVDEDEMARRGKILKDMDRVHREYKCVRMTLDPSLESLARCLARLGKSPLDLQRGQLHGDKQMNESSGYGQQYKLQQQRQQQHQQHQQQQQQQQQQQHQQQYQQVGLGLRPS